MKIISLVFLFLFSFAVLAAEIYRCPMLCEGQKTYEKAGSCPVCGMGLEKKTQGSRPLNTTDYRMDLVTGPAAVKAGEKAVLNFTPRRTKDNSVVRPLEVIHEKPMHLILVTQELDWFAHEHPEAQKDGSYKLELTFPRSGNYVLYSDVTPPGDRNQVFPLALKVEGVSAKTKAAALKDSSKETRKIGDYAVTLKLSPGAKPEVPVTFEYQIKKGGKSVTDLEPYLGAMGHLVILSEDTTQYLHAHPPGDHHDHGGSHGHAAKAGDKDVKFVTAFPRAGIYKAWLQFKHEGTVRTADFVLNVK